MIPFLAEFRKNSLFKLQSFLDSRAFYGVLITLLSISGFSLGRVSSIFSQKPIFSTEELALEGVQKSMNLNQFAGVSTSTIVASKKGKKYYFVWCKQASSLKEANKIYFKDEESAKRTGRTLASGCQ